MRTRHIAVLTAFLALPFSSIPGRAQSDAIAIVAPPTLSNWSERVFREIGSRIKYRGPMGGFPGSTRIVTVQFTRSESGAPTNIQLRESSGHRNLDHATLRGVSKVATLHPLPRGLRHDQIYVVRILFSNSPDNRKNQLEKMEEEAARSNSWYAEPSSVAGAVKLLPVGI